MVSRRGIVAAFRPRENNVALFVENGVEHAAVALSIDEARRIHGALGQALKLADCREDPLEAVPGAKDEWVPTIGGGKPTGGAG